ncbi:MAG: PH domain-containing protein [Rhodothermales bacterium]
MRSLHPSIRTVWRIKLAAFWAFVFVAILVYEIVQWLSTGNIWLVPGSRAFLVALVAGVIVVLVPRLRYRYWRYELRDDELFLERGILNRVRTIVPLRRIQHIDVSQDILEREFDLGKLIVHTAGTRSSDVVLPGLVFADAEAMRDELKQHILEDVL